MSRTHATKFPLRLEDQLIVLIFSLISGEKQTKSQTKRKTVNQEFNESMMKITDTYFHLLELLDKSEDTLFLIRMKRIKKFDIKSFNVSSSSLKP